MLTPVLLAAVAGLVVLLALRGPFRDRRRDHETRAAIDAMLEAVRSARDVEQDALRDLSRGLEALVADLRRESAAKGRR